MFYYLTIFGLFALYVILQVGIFKKLRDLHRGSLNKQEEELNGLCKEERFTENKIKELEAKINEVFFVYEITRDFSLYMEKEGLFEVLKDKLKYFGNVEDVVWSDSPQKGYFNYEVKISDKKFISLRTVSPKLKEYFPLLLRQFTLCLERIELYQKMQHLSIYDSLTQIPNRRHFMARFYEEFERAKKFKLALSFLMVDIDFFKKINDTYGHLVGDAVLREVASHLKENIREIDFLARWGGEEFAVILLETDKAGAILVGERIVQRLASSPLGVFDELLNVTISIGVATYPANAFHSDMLIETADKALYKAKQEGRNRVGWF